MLEAIFAGELPRLGVVQRLFRQELAPEELPRAIQVGLCKLQIGFALANGGARNLERRFRLLHLFGHLTIFNTRYALPASDGVAELHIYVFEATGGFRHDGDGLLADEITDNRELLRHVRA